MNTYKSLLVIFTLLLIIGCSKEPEQQSDKQLEKPDFMTREQQWEWELEHQKPQPILDEPFYDPATYKEWRAQVFWRHPLDKGFTVWSTNLHGSDLRRAVKYEVLKEGGCATDSIRERVVRSPNNRYIAFSFSDQESNGYLCLVDLKEKSAKVAAESSEYIRKIHWAPDSNSLLMYYGNFFSEYLVDQDKVRPFIRNIRSKSFNVSRDGKIYAFGLTQYEVFNFKGELIEIVNPGKIVLNDETMSIGGFDRVSWDGKNISIDINGDMYILDLTDNYRVIFKHDRGAGGWLGPYGKNYYFGRGFPSKIDLSTSKIIWGKYIYPRWMIKYPPSGLSLFNMQDQ